jgi:predicted DNA-binding transcriptional regulator YafY
MTRLTRLTNILFHLQSKRVVTSQELADKFGISQRTVYRDIKALEEAGVPIIGEVGKGYCLMDDYRIPPVMFTEQELNALLTAQQLVKNQSDKSLQKNFEDLTFKIKALLKYTAKEKLETLESRVLVYGNNKNSKTEFLSIIQSAIVNLQVIKIQYHTIYSDTIKERLVEPLAVYFTKDNWLLIAHCRLRNEIREFRIDRILKLTNTYDTFQDRNFSFDEYIQQHSENS